MTNTIAYNESLTREQQIASTRLAKGGSWYDDNYTPYCLSPVCSDAGAGTVGAMPRMKMMSYGFKCGFCSNIIGWDMKRLKESPLNHIA